MPSRAARSSPTPPSTGSSRRSRRARVSTSPSSRSSSGPSNGRRSATIRRSIPSAHFVDDLAPYIERKLFTVNTGHATTAYFGAAAGVEKISDALADAAIAAKVAAALEETSALLVAKHGLDPADLADYRATILRRFRNPLLPDTVWRVGRQPLRKLSRHERFVGPAAEAAERGLSRRRPWSAAMGAALAFDDPEDEQSVDLQRMLREQDAETFTATVTGLEPEHPLFAKIEASRGRRQADLGRLTAPTTLDA